MARRDERYALIRRMIEYGEIKEIRDMLKFIPKTTIGRDLNIKSDRITRLMNKPEDFSFHEIFQIAAFCELEEEKLVDLVINEYRNKKKDAT
jgi:hypothetical protein